MNEEKEKLRKPGKPKQPTRKPLLLRLDDHIFDKLKQMADADDRSLSNFCTRILEREIPKDS